MTGVSYIQQGVNMLQLTLSGKNEDYAPTDEFSNFRQAAQFAGIEEMQVILAQIAIKYTRLQALADVEGTPNYESVQDTLLDLAGYAVIGYARLDAEREMVECTPIRSIKPHWYDSTPIEEDR